MVFVVAAAAAGAALVLYLLVERTGAAGIPLAALRAIAWGSVVLLLLNPGCHRAGAAAPAVVLLDRSLSMTDPGDPPAGGARWRAALDSAEAIAGQARRIILFGAEPGALREGVRPEAAATRLLPAWREAAALGGPVSVVTDGEVDDARDLPPDFTRTRVVVLPRPGRTDVGVAGFDLPLAVRASDTVTAAVALVAVGTAPRDSALVELREGTGTRARVVARVRVGIGAGGTLRRDVKFVPTAPAGDQEVRRYEVRVRGVKGDAEPRDDARLADVEVSRASTIALFSDSPDWDFRTLATTLAATSGVPVSAFVHLASGSWRDASTLGLASERAVDAAATGAALVVVHGTPQGASAILARARRNVWRWTVDRAAAAAGDWYVVPSNAPSPLGAALAGVPPESLPPLETVSPAGPDSSAWIGLVAALARRGTARPVLIGSEAGGRRTVRIVGSGLWRWASAGGVAREGYRALTAAVTDWLLTERERAGPALAARNDSLNRGLEELLPRPRTLRSQPGSREALSGAMTPVRQSPWLYAAALGALMIEWIARRRRGMR